MNRKNNLKIILYKVGSAASLVWLICVVVVIGILALATRLMTHDPDLAPGMPENVYLMPMLVSGLVGSIAFLISFIGGFITFFLKERVKPLFGVPIKASALMVFILIFGSISFLFGYRQANIANYRVDTTYTGQDVLNAINEYRLARNLTPLSLEPNICDNLVQRYLDLENPDNTYAGHIGFERWVKNEGLEELYQAIAENYVKEVLTPQEAISFWEGSPGHRLTLEGDYDVGCAYANNGIAVVVFGKRK